jgi:hypothetical protein
VRFKTWSENQLRQIVPQVHSVRQLLIRLNLKPCGGNYSQLLKYIKVYNVDTSHFTGKVWNKGLSGIGKPRVKLDALLVKGGNYQSFKLKKRLFEAGLKTARCELCGWSKKTLDGRIPVELDHINGDNQDNRLENLRILCPNCHSLQPTHRGKNIKKNGRGGGMVDTQHLKCCAHKA